MSDPGEYRSLGQRLRKVWCAQGGPVAGANGDHTPRWDAVAKEAVEAILPEMSTKLFLDIERHCADDMINQITGSVNFMRQRARTLPAASPEPQPEAEKVSDEMCVCGGDGGVHLPACPCAIHRLAELRSQRDGLYWKLKELKPPLASGNTYEYWRQAMGEIDAEFGFTRPLGSVFDSLRKMAGRPLERRVMGERRSRERRQQERRQLRARRLNRHFRSDFSDSKGRRKNDPYSHLRLGERRVRDRRSLPGTPKGE